jgi:hypothetical protein
MELQTMIALAIAYLLYCLTLAGAVQVAINQVKPLFLEPIKERVTERQYLIVIYVFRAIITAAAYFWLWGGIAATRAVLGGMPASIPDAGVAIVTIALVVLGEEIIHPLVSRLYVLKDTVGELGEVTIPVQASTDVTVHATN